MISNTVYSNGFPANFAGLTFLRERGESLAILFLLENTGPNENMTGLFGQQAEESVNTTGAIGKGI